MKSKYISTALLTFMVFSLLFSACSSAPAPTASATEYPTQVIEPTTSPTTLPAPTETLAIATHPPFVPTFIASSNVAYLNGSAFVLGDDGIWRIAPESYLNVEHSFPQGADIVVVYNDKHSRLDAYDLPEGVEKFFIIPAGNEEGRYPALKYCMSDPCGTQGWSVISKPKILNITSTQEDHADSATPAPENEITLTSVQLYNLTNWTGLAGELKVCYRSGSQYAEPQPCLRALPTETLAPTAVPSTTPIPFSNVGIGEIFLPEYVSDGNDRITALNDLLVVDADGEVGVISFVEAESEIDFYSARLIIFLNQCKDRFQVATIPGDFSGKILYKGTDCKIYAGNSSVPVLNFSSLQNPTTDLQRDILTLEQGLKHAKYCRTTPGGSIPNLCRAG